MSYPRDWQTASFEQFTQALDSYIRWYNEKRIKILLGALRPVEYRKSVRLAAQLVQEFCRTFLFWPRLHQAKHIPKLGTPQRVTVAQIRLGLRVDRSQVHFCNNALGGGVNYFSYGL